MELTLMPWCPNCRTTFVKGVDTCPDCGAELAEGRPPGPPDWFQVYSQVWLSAAAVLALASLGVFHGYLFATGLAALDPSGRWVLSALALPPLVSFGLGRLSAAWLRAYLVIIGWLLFGCVSLWFYLPHAGNTHMTPTGASPFAIPAVLVVLWPSVGAVATLCGVRYGATGLWKYAVIPPVWAAVVVVETIRLLAVS